MAKSITVKCSNPIPSDTGGMHVDFAVEGMFDDALYGEVSLLKSGMNGPWGSWGSWGPCADYWVSNGALAKIQAHDSSSYILGEIEAKAVDCVKDYEKAQKFSEY